MKRILVVVAFVSALGIGTARAEHDRGEGDGGATPCVAPFSSDDVQAFVDAYSSAVVAQVLAALRAQPTPTPTPTCEAGGFPTPQAPAPVRFRVFKQRRNGTLIPTQRVIVAE